MNQNTRTVKILMCISLEDVCFFKKNCRSLQTSSLQTIAVVDRKQHVQLEFSRVRLQALALLLTVLRNSIQFNTLQSFIL